MKLKSILCAALSAAMLTAGALAAETTEVKPLDSEKLLYEVTQNTMEPVRVWGSAVELGDKSVRLENSNETDAYNKIILNITDETVILDAVTGEVKTFADLKKDEIIYAYTSSMMTRSMPPISNAVLVLCNIPADYHVPTFAEVQKVSVNEDGDYSVLMSGDIILHLDKDTPLTAYGTKNIPALTDIVPGTRLLSWYSAVALSLPAQASPGKVLVFPSEYAGYASMNSVSEIFLNGEKLDMTGYAENGKLMLPVRAFAEALGCEVIWDAKNPTRVVVEKNGERLYDLTLGGETMVVEGDMVMDVTAPAVSKDRVTYFSADDLLRLHSLKLETSAPVLF